MFERFTDRARKIFALANQEAIRFNNEYIGTEHILLGIVKEGSNSGCCILKELDIDLRKVRLETEKLIKQGPDMVTIGKLPQTPRSKKVVEYAMEEARGMGHNYVGSEHVLLGLLREHNGVAAQVLMNLGVTLEKAKEVMAGFAQDEKEELEKKISAIRKFGFFASKEWEPKPDTAQERGEIAEAEVRRFLAILSRNGSVVDIQRVSNALGIISEVVKGLPK